MREKAINRVELLVHPFYGSGGHRIFFPTTNLPAESYEAFARIWAKQVLKIKRNPNALLVIVRYPSASGQSYQQRFFGHASKQLGERLVELPGYLDVKLLKKKLHESNLAVSADAEVIAYGELREACVAMAFNEFLEAFKIPFNRRKTMIRTDLSMGIFLDKVSRGILRKRLTREEFTAMAKQLAGERKKSGSLYFRAPKGRLR